MADKDQYGNRTLPDPLIVQLQTRMRRVEAIAERWGPPNFVVLECHYESGHEWDLLRVIGPFPSEDAAKAWIGAEPPGAGQDQGTNYWDVVPLHDPAETRPDHG